MGASLGSMDGLPIVGNPRGSSWSKSSAPGQRQSPKGVRRIGVTLPDTPGKAIAMQDGRAPSFRGSRTNPTRRENRAPSQRQSTKPRAHRTGRRQAQTLEAGGIKQREDEAKFRCRSFHRRSIHLGQIRPHCLALVLAICLRQEHAFIVNMYFL